MCLPFATMGKVWTVDNSPNAAADTSSLQGAQNAASSGDTIIVMPSFTSYGAVTFTKKLLVYSSCHQPDFIQKDKRATLSTITINTGVTGLILAGFYINERVYLNGNQCKIISNELNVGIFIQGSNNLVEGNLISGFFWALFNPSYLGIAGNAKNNIIKNNYFSFRTNGSVVGASFGFVNGGDTSNSVKNNLFIELVDGGGAINNGGIVFFRSSSAKIYNNIFWSNVVNRTDFDSLSNNPDFQKNITYSAKSNTDTLPGSNFNNIQPQFEGGYNDTLLPFYRATNKMQLKSSSVGKNGGTDSKDVGLYGANYNFIIDGTVPWVVPFRSFYLQKATVKQGEAIQLNIQLNTTN